MRRPFRAASGGLWAEPGRIRITGVTTDVMEVRYDPKVQEAYLARADRAVLMIKFAGVVGAIAMAVLALTVMDGMSRWALLVVAVIDLPVFLWYLPSVMNKPRRAMREVHSRGGVLFTMNRHGVVRPHPTAGVRGRAGPLHTRGAELESAAADLPAGPVRRRRGQGHQHRAEPVDRRSHRRAAAAARLISA